MLIRTIITTNKAPPTLPATGIAMLFPEGGVPDSGITGEWVDTVVIATTVLEGVDAVVIATRVLEGVDSVTMVLESIGMGGIVELDGSDIT